MKSIMEKIIIAGFAFTLIAAPLVETSSSSIEPANEEITTYGIGWAVNY